MQAPFPAYAGSDPYVFVSYSHADARDVFPELETLRAANVNVWYDEGISPGSRWTDELAERISNAALVILFVTPGAAVSEHCRNEIEFALKEKRRILLVYLKSVDLPRGMDLALSGIQAIHRERYTSSDFRQKLIQAVAALTEGARVDVDAFKTRTVRTRKRWYVAAALIVVAVAGGIGLYIQQEESAPKAVRSEPLLLLISDFRNETGEPVFDGVLEEALRVGMEGAPFVTSYSRKDARRVLTRLRKDETLTSDAARLVAAHEGLELVLSGTVRREGGRYLLVVEGVDPLTDVVRVRASEAAESPLEALTAVAELCETLRAALGDVTMAKSHLNEIFTASSIDAVSEFAMAQALAADWKHAEAMQHYDRAIAQDSEFARAYGGWAYSASVLGQRELSQRLWDECLARIDTMTERERLRTLGIYYMTMSGNVEKAIESYSALVERYPADAAARNNLAVALFTRGDLLKARDAGGELLSIYPRSLLYLSNYSLYNMYIADMEQAVEYANRVLEIDPKHSIAFLPLAMEALLRVDYDQAEAWYAAMSATEGQGASLAAYGRADVLLARGDRDAAATLLAEGAAADDAVEDGSGATMKRLALARAQLGAGDRGAVEATLGQVRDIESADRHEVEWAELQVALGKTEEAQSVANRLAAKVSAQSRAYAEYVRGTAHAAAGDHLGAVEALTRSIAVRDTWLARSARGVAYLQAGYAVEATDELDLAWRRRGEGIAVFLDDTPSYLRIVELHYWRGRAREAGGMTEAAIEAYEQFLKVRDRADRDSNVLDARQRLQALRDATK